MIEKKTIVDQVEVIRDGTLQIRFGLLLLEDGVQVDCKWHRTSVEPGGDVDAQIAAVNQNLAQMGRPAVSEGVERIEAVAQAAHTDAVVAAFNATKKVSAG